MDPWDGGQHAGQGRAGQGTNKADDDRPSRGQADQPEQSSPAARERALSFLITSGSVNHTKWSNGAWSGPRSRSGGAK